MDVSTILFLYLMVFGVSSQIDPCKRHSIIDDYRRDPDYTVRGSQRRLCDNLLVPGWYRFQINGTDADMPTTCAQVNGCGTLAPLWLSAPSDGLPLPGKQTSGNACATWKFPGRPKQCCGFRIKIQIRNCGEFFVYKLRNTGGCDLAFCAKVPNTFCPVGQIYIRHLQRCIDYKVGITKPSIDVITVKRQIYINCTFDIPSNDVIVPITPTFHIIWYRLEGATTFTIKSSFITTNFDSLKLGEDAVPGETVTCSVESLQGQVRKVSKPYFLGIKVNESVMVQEDGDLYRLTYISTIPIVCTDVQTSKCKLDLVLKLRGKHQAGHPDFLFSSCLLEFVGGEDTCEDGTCIEKTVKFRMIPNLRHLLNDRLDLRGTIYADESISWNQRFLSTTIQYTDLSSSVCFALPGIQMLTFSDRKLQCRRRGTYILLTSETGEVEIHIRVDICDDTQLCICGIVIRYGDSFLSVDSCNSKVNDMNNNGHGKYASNFYKGRNGQMNIYEGRSGWLIYIMLEQRVRIRLDFGHTGIVVAVLMSGYFNNKVSGLCGNISSTMFPRQRIEADSDWSTTWRIRPGSSYFERQTVPPEFIPGNIEPDSCDCSTANMDDLCPSPGRSRDPITLISLKEVTNSWITKTNNSHIPVYAFDGDYDSWPFVNESVAVIDKTEAGDRCLKLLLTSKITRSCNFYLDQYFETVLQICTELARYQHNSSWIAVTLRMLEGLCEIGIISNKNNSILNDTTEITEVYIKDIMDDVICPENCHGNGVCTSGGCKCFTEFYGVECLKKAESNIQTETTVASTPTDSTTSTIKSSTPIQPTTEATQPSIHIESTTTAASNDHDNIKFVSCDVRESSCSTVYLELGDGVNTFAVTCVVFPVQYSDTGWRPTGRETNSTIRYINTNLVECMLPDEEYIDYDFRVYNVQVMDARWEKLSSMLYAVVDGDCQRCDKTDGCTIQNESCFIDGNCYEEFDYNPDDRCEYCKPDEDKWDWSPRSDNKSPMFDGGNPVYSIMENDTLVTQFTATDPDGDGIKYNLDREDATINRHGNFRWRPTMHVNSINGSSEMFMVTIYDECGLATTIIVTIYVLKCDCKNNGSCPERIVSTNSSLDYQCDCQDNYKGHRCETTTNPCQYNPCYPGVSCTPDNSGSYTCGQCPNGLIGDGIKCVRGCRTNPCYPGTTCRNTMYPDYGYKCGNCPRFFYGNGIECNRTDENPCNLDVCSPLVSCNETDFYPGYKCGSCPKGYLGNGSSCTAICIPPCENGNICISPGHCVCTPQADCKDCRTNPCFPGVKCTTIKQYPGYKCENCPRYFTGNGVNCTRNGKSACNHGVCSPLVSCRDVGSYPGYVCGTCPSGYIGDGETCNAVCNLPCESGNICDSPGNCICDPSKNCTGCSSNPCFHGVNCESIRQYPGYRCGSCPNFYDGDGVNCVRNDDSACMHDVCSRLVTCSDVKEYPGFRCSSCPEGYRGTGTNCIAQCIPPCGDDKVCVAPNRCECRAAYSRNCTTDTVSCANDPCFIGVPCKDTSNQSPSFMCGRCPRFFQGDGVECNRTADDACTANVCSSLVTCNNSNAYPGYTCGKCPSGYKGDGKICTAVCDSSCRFPRTCVSPGKCDCSPGFGGYNCRTPLCCPKCRNQGICYWPNKCKCRTGYYGFRCEKAICNPGCGPGQFCKAPGVCSCPKGYTGPNCSVSMCNPPCQNGGRCVRPDVCVCTKEFCGPRCGQTKCRRKCEHGGICIAYNRCLCTMGYRGRFCQRPRCLQNCQNGGVCDSKGTCRCQYGYYGQFCQKASCNPGCYNGGVCRRQNVCKCRTGYYGHRCQYATCRRQCYNGGRCVAPNKCRCRYGWGGRYCMRARCPFGCQNGGVCARPGVCICKRGFWGNYCQYDNIFMKNRTQFSNKLPRKR